MASYLLIYRELHCIGEVYITLLTDSCARTSILRTPQETGAVGLSYFNNVENGLPLFDTDNLCIK